MAKAADATSGNQTTETEPWEGLRLVTGGKLHPHEAVYKGYIRGSFIVLLVRYMSGQN